jgi:hypothetical protein
MAPDNGDMPTLTYAYTSTFLIRSEVSIMSIKTRKYLMIFTLCAAATALYGTAAYRVEQARMQPSYAASCNHGQCVGHMAAFSSLR